MKSFICSFVVAVGIGGVCPRVASARVITDFIPPGSSPIAVATPTPNNDNTTLASPNQIDLPGTAPTLSIASLDPVDIVFGLQHSTGSTEYYFRQTVVNNSGFAWNGFKLQLGVAGGSSFPGVALVDVARPRFDFPGFDPTPANTMFATLGGTNGFFELSWTNGLVPVGGSMSMTFSVDTPEDLPNPPSTTCASAWGKFGPAEITARPVASKCTVQP